MPPGDRLHAMDNLRALAMLAGVAFHAALAYSPLMHPIWPAADPGNSVVVDAVAWFVHLFRMPLFFAIAGYFSARLVTRRAMTGLFRHRCRRVLLPLLVLAPPLIASMTWLTERAAETVSNPSPALAWIGAYVDRHGDMPAMPGWAHLWFLFYLMLFTLLVWIASALDLGRIVARLAGMPPLALVAAGPLLTAPALAMVGVPWPAPEFFVPALWALAFFGLYFAFGYQLCRHDRLLDRLNPLSPFLLAGALTAYVALFRSTDGFMAERSPGWQHGVRALLEACAGCWMTLWCLLAAKRWLDSRCTAMRWLADSAYWVYLIHLPVLLAIQYRMLDMPWHWTIKLATSLALTFMLSFASYQVLVRHTVIGRWLNGGTAPTHGIDGDRVVAGAPSVPHDGSPDHRDAR